MPQLDFSSFSSQFFWLFISFMLMWLIMANFIVPKIADIINQRQRKIDDFLNAAGEFKHTAEETIQKYERALEKSNAKAAEAVRKAEEKLQQKIDEQSEENRKQLQALKDENAQKIAENKKDTMAKIEEISILLATQITAKMGLNEISAEDFTQVAQQERKNG